MDVAEDQLVTEAVKGDESALAALLEEAGLQLHADLQHKIGPKYRSLVDADDILQVTCLEAFLRIRSFVPGGAGSFAAWLRRIGENNLLDAIRELERDKRPPPGRRAAAADDASYVALIERVAMTTTTASRVFARDEVRSSVDAALQQLPPDYERALRLYELEGLSGEEVAERMGRSHGAVRMLLARAREALAELLGSPSRFF